LLYRDIPILPSLLKVFTDDYNFMRIIRISKL
jgi:hypothetical protein